MREDAREKTFLSRRDLFRAGGAAGIAARLAFSQSAKRGSSPSPLARAAANVHPPSQEAIANEKGSQRLTLANLQAWEGLKYGMFIHFGLSTFTGQEWSDGKASATTYNPDKLDVDQWIQVARDAGMKYAVLTTKHVAGHCLWPSRCTEYTVAHSGNRADVVEAFVNACQRHGIQPGLYYCSFDNHHTFGSVTIDHAGLPYDTVEQVYFIERSGRAYTTSPYQDFETAQITELLSRYGPIAEVWIDDPGVLGLGYRTFLYHHIAELQPDCVIVMNGSYGDPEKFDPWFTWPQDVIGYEQYLPPSSGHPRWRTIKGKRYYLPAEVYDTVGSHWFWVEGDHPKPEGALLTLYEESRKRRANLLLDVPPNKHGLIPDLYRDALIRLRRNAGL